MQRLAKIFIKNQIVTSSQDYITSVSPVLLLALSNRLDVPFKDKGSLFCGSSYCGVEDSWKSRAQFNRLSAVELERILNESLENTNPKESSSDCSSKEGLDCFLDSLGTPSTNSYTDRIHGGQDVYTKGWKSNTTASIRPSSQIETKRLKIDKNVAKEFLQNEGVDSFPYKLFDLTGNYLLGMAGGNFVWGRRKEKAWKHVPRFHEYAGSQNASGKSTMQSYLDFMGDFMDKLRGTEKGENPYAGYDSLTRPKPLRPMKPADVPKVPLAIDFADNSTNASQQQEEVARPISSPLCRNPELEIPLGYWTLMQLFDRNKLIGIRPVNDMMLSTCGLKDFFCSPEYEHESTVAKIQKAPLHRSVQDILESKGRDSIKYIGEHRELGFIIMGDNDEILGVVPSRRNARSTSSTQEKSGELQDSGWHENLIVGCNMTRPCPRSHTRLEVSASKTRDPMENAVKLISGFGEICNAFLYMGQPRNRSGYVRGSISRQTKSGFGARDMSCRARGFGSFTGLSIPKIESLPNVPIAANSCGNISKHKVVFSSYGQDGKDLTHTNCGSYGINFLVDVPKSPCSEISGSNHSQDMEDPDSQGQTKPKNRKAATISILQVGLGGACDDRSSMLDGKPNIGSENYGQGCASVRPENLQKPSTKRAAVDGSKAFGEAVIVPPARQSNDLSQNGQLQCPQLPIMCYPGYQGPHPQASLLQGKMHYPQVCPHYIGPSAIQQSTLPQQVPMPTMQEEYTSPQPATGYPVDSTASIDFRATGGKEEELPKYDTSHYSPSQGSEAPTFPHAYHSGNACNSYLSGGCNSADGSFVSPEGVQYCPWPTASPCPTHDEKMIEHPLSASSLQHPPSPMTDSPLHSGRGYPTGTSPSGPSNCYCSWPCDMQCPEAPTDLYAWQPEPVPISNGYSGTTSLPHSYRGPAFQSHPSGLYESTEYGSSTFGTIAPSYISMPQPYAPYSLPAHLPAQSFCAWVPYSQMPFYSIASAPPSALDSSSIMDTGTMRVTGPSIEMVAGSYGPSSAGTIYPGTLSFYPETLPASYHSAQMSNPCITSPGTNVVSAMPTFAPVAGSGIPSSAGTLMPSTSYSATTAIPPPPPASAFLAIPSNVPPVATMPDSLGMSPGSMHGGAAQGISNIPNSSEQLNVSKCIPWMTCPFCHSYHPYVNNMPRLQPRDSDYLRKSIVMPFVESKEVEVEDGAKVKPFEKCSESDENKDASLENPVCPLPSKPISIDPMKYSDVENINFSSYVVQALLFGLRYLVPPVGSSTRRLFSSKSTKRLSAKPCGCPYDASSSCVSNLPGLDGNGCSLPPTTRSLQGLEVGHGTGEKCESASCSRSASPGEHRPIVRIPPKLEDLSTPINTYRSVEAELRKINRQSFPGMKYYERGLFKVFSELGIAESNKSSYGGEWIGSGCVTPAYDPAMSCKIVDVVLPTRDEVDQCIQSAKEASKVWMSLQPPCRAVVLREVARGIAEKRESLAKLISLEVGKVLVDAMCEVYGIINMFEYAAGLAATLSGNVFESERPNHIIMERFHPLGMTGVITAFNTPYSTFGKSASISLAVGNSVVFKPAPTTILSSIALMKIISSTFKSFGLPPVVACVQGDAEVGKLLAEDERVDIVAFSGGAENGHDVGLRVQNRFGKSLLNLRGNNGIIVNHDANFESALNAATLGVVDFAGQKKQKVSQIIVHRLLYERFVEELAKRFEKIKKFCGHPLDPRSIFGPLHSESITQGYIAAVRKIRDAGGKVEVGGNKIFGNFVEPALVTNISAKSELMAFPVVGPLAFVVPAANIDEAVEINNSFSNRVISSVFTKNVPDVYRFIGPHGLLGGVISVNTANTGTELTVPLGGEKAAGGGRFSGSDIWRDYCRRVAVNLNFSSSLPYAHGFGCKYIERFKTN